jgi:hypothetical protein
MGASVWSYFVPYQADIGAALRHLQEQEFAAGDYHQIPPYWRGMTFEEWNTPNPDDPETYTEAELAERFIEYQRWQNMPDPTTIAALQEWNGEEGCHSILDMEGVFDQPYGEFAKVSPLSDDDLFDLFEDELPTHEMVVAHADEFDEFRDRWEGLYIIVYKDGQPDEICFAGFSGD